MKNHYSIAKHRLPSILGPTILALAATLANAVKPVVVDDAAYLTFARHIAGHPLDPYGFRIFWYTVPDPAMEVLCPPVVPYWLALGIRIFGESPPLLKLWIFPFIWLFAWSLRAVLRRFTGRAERLALPLIVLSPAILSTINLMLDVPAAALGLAALVLFIRAADGGKWHLAVAAGAISALAMQTKYTALLVPVVFAWYGLTHRKIFLAGLGIATAVLVFAGWEYLLILEYDQSHFLFHLREQSERAEPEGGRVTALFREKAALVAPLIGHLGCLAIGIGLFAGRAIGMPRGLLLATAAAWTVGAGLVATLPFRDTILIPGRSPASAKLDIGTTVWRTAGTAVSIAAATSAGALLARFRRRRFVRWAPDSWFVVGWAILELAAYFPLTPFPAARRAIGLTVALGVLAARVVGLVGRARHDRQTPSWVVPFGVAVGAAIAALDIYDSYPEKVLAERAAAIVRDRSPPGMVWYSGHWGFQYYCERAGMRPAFWGGSMLAPGDYLVVPVYPDAVAFYRPAPAGNALTPPPNAVELVADLVWDDHLSAQTIPNFYGGSVPVACRDHPRLRVAVYLVKRAWEVGKER